MNSAISLAKQNNYGFRIVTLEGDVINSSGAISGGFVEQKTVNILGRSREIEELKTALKELKLKIEKTSKEKEEYSEETTDIIESSARLEKELQEIEIHYATKKQELTMLENQLTNLENKVSKLKKTIRRYRKRKGKHSNIYGRCKSSNCKLRKRIAELNAEISKFAELNKDDQTYIDNLNTDITDLKISVSSFDESGSSLDEMLERINQDIKNAQEQIQSKTQEIENTKQETIKKEEEIESLNKEIEKIKGEVSNSSEKIEKLKQDRTIKNSDSRKNRSKNRRTIWCFKWLKRTNCKSRKQKTRQEQDLDELVNKLWTEYELTPNNAGEYKNPKMLHLLKNVQMNLEKTLQT